MKIYNIEGYKTELAEDATFTLKGKNKGWACDDKDFSLHENTLVIKAGYKWDGASGPTIDTPEVTVASLVHDVGYEMIRLGYIPRNGGKHWFDRQLMHIIRTYKTEDLSKLNRAWRWFRGWYYYAGVTIGGGGATKAKKHGEANRTAIDV